MSLIHSRRRRNQTRPRARNRKLALEQCESRELLAVFTVTSPLDSGAVGELRWAVASANLNPGLDFISFAPNLGPINLNAGELPITDPVVINAPSIDPANLVEINAANSSRIFRVDDSNPNSMISVTMHHLALRGGDVTSFVNSGQGGGILNHENLEMRRCFMGENHAVVGGSIANHGFLATFECNITESTASGAGGGGIWNAPLGTTFFSGGSIEANEATIGSGGGILNDGGAVVTITGEAEVRNNSAAQRGGGLAVVDGSLGQLEAVTFESNTAAVGGGVYVRGLGSHVSSTEATSIQWNEAGQRGGGLALAAESGALLRGSLVTGNLSFGDGGGISVGGGSDATVRGAEVLSNLAGLGGFAGRGGGIFADGGSSVQVENSNVSYNGLTAILAPIEAGGGIYAGDGVALTVRDSRLNTNAAQRGGGIFAASVPADLLITSVSVTDTLIENNISYTGGGGIFGSGALDLFLKCTTVTGNVAWVGSGGGVHLQGAAEPLHIIADFVDTNINWNSAGTNGGGIYSHEGVSLNLRNSLVTGNNAAERGGGLYLAGGDDTNGINRTDVSFSLVSGNVASLDVGPAGIPRDGGGVWAGYGAVVDIATTTIEGNSAETNGGGVHVQSSVDFLMQNSTVSGNMARNGAGASVVRSDARFLQTTFYANRADVNGGGVFVQGSGLSTVDIDHSTISINSAALLGTGRGGGIFVGANAVVGGPVVNLNHTIVSTNLSSPLAGFDEVFDSGTGSGVVLVTAQFSLLRDNVGTNFAPGNPDPNGNIIGSAVAPIDAILGPLSNNGGPTLTMRPSNASPAIGAGNPFFSGPPNFDQRLSPFVRVLGRIDMGAVEVQPPPPTPDFNGDGVADCADINALTLDIALGLNSPQFDLTGDGAVNHADLEQWLDDAPDVNGLAIERYLHGDANLDTVVDGMDFIIWNNNKFSLNAEWCSGDFTADGVINGQDFIVWNANKFTSSPPLTGCGFFPAASTHRELEFVGDRGGDVMAQPTPMINATADSLGATTSVRATPSTPLDDGFDVVPRGLERVPAAWVALEDRGEVATERTANDGERAEAARDQLFAMV